MTLPGRHIQYPTGINSPINHPSSWHAHKTENWLAVVVGIFTQTSIQNFTKPNQHRRRHRSFSIRYAFICCVWARQHEHDLLLSSQAIAVGRLKIALQHTQHSAIRSWLESACVIDFWLHTWTVYSTQHCYSISAASLLWCWFNSPKIEQTASRTVYSSGEKINVRLRNEEEAP